MDWRGTDIDADNGRVRPMIADFLGAHTTARGGRVRAHRGCPKRVREVHAFAVDHHDLCVHRIVQRGFGRAADRGLEHAKRRAAHLGSELEHVPCRRW